MFGLLKRLSSKANSSASSSNNLHQKPDDEIYNPILLTPAKILQQYDQNGLTSSSTPVTSSSHSSTTLSSVSHVSTRHSPQQSLDDSWYEDRITRFMTYLQHHLLSWIYQQINRISDWKHVNDVVVVNRKGRLLPAFSVYRPLLHFHSIEDVLFIVVLLCLCVCTDHSVVSIRWKFLFCNVLWMISLIQHDIKVLQIDWKSFIFSIFTKKATTTTTTPQSPSIQIISSKHSTKYSPHPTVIESLQQSDFTISSVRILPENQTSFEEPVNFPEIEISQKLKESTFYQELEQYYHQEQQANRQRDDHNDEEEDEEEDVFAPNSLKISANSNSNRPTTRTKEKSKLASKIASRLQFQITIQHHRKRWFVWKTYRECRYLYNVIMQKYPFIYIPKLASFNKLLHFFRKEFLPSNGNLHGNNQQKNFKTFQSFQMLSFDNVEFCENEEFLQLLQIELLNWLFALRNCRELQQDDDIRQFLHYPDLSTFYGEAHIVKGHAQLQRPTVYELRLENQVLNSSDSAKSTVNMLVDVEEEYFQQINSAVNSVKTTTMNLPTAAPVVESTTTETNEILSQFGLHYRGTTWLDFEFLDLNENVQNMAKEGRYVHNYKVRGLTYLKDKQKQYPGNAIGRLLLVELYAVKSEVFGDRHDHIASIGKVAQRLQIIREVLQDDAFIFLLNIQIPGDPPVSMLLYFLIPSTFAQGDNESNKTYLEKAEKLFQKFVDIPYADDAEDFIPKKQHKQHIGSASESTSKNTKLGVQETNAVPSTSIIDNSRASISKRTSFMAPSPQKSWTQDIVWPLPGKDQPGVLSKDSFQNLRFKLIPQMLEAPWVVQMAVSSTPCLLGQKIVQRYFRGYQYLEIDLHVGSSAIAQNVVGICRQYSKTFVCNLGIVVQGESEDELPEQVICCTTINHMDLTYAEELKLE